MVDKADESENGGGWMPRERCDALVRGEGCPLCGDLAVGTQPNAYRHVVADLTVSPLWLPVNRSVGSTGYNVRQRRAPAPYLQTGLPRGRQRGGRGDVRASGAQRDAASLTGTPRGETETHTK